MSSTPTPDTLPTVFVFGAGLIGSYLGLSLAATDAHPASIPRIHLIGRDRLVAKHQRLHSSPNSRGFRITFRRTIHSAEETHRIDPRTLACHASLDAAVKAVPGRGPNFLVIALKRFDNEAAVEALRRCGFSEEGRRKGWRPEGAEGEGWYWEGTTVVMFQNGAGAAASLRDALADAPPPSKPLRADSKIDSSSGPAAPGLDVVDGMWFFNVVEPEEGHWQQGSVGAICIPDTEKGRWLQAATKKAGLDCRVAADMDAMVYGKLLMNMNNAVSALSALPLKREMHTHEYRQVLAECQLEALEVFKAAGIKPMSSTVIPSHLIPYFLMMPDVVYAAAAGKVFAVDEKATSSMYEDIKANRRTEIDFFQGEISRLGKLHGIPTPVCDVVVRRVKELEAKKCGLVPHTAKEILGQ
ncbi:hypothetical protein HDU96_007108 [Phlyctochytrium bullatum]|nr:hypothetical protein HDU96_007108 [Phlyctochytrium bullatum]